MAASSADLSEGVLGMFAGLEDDERLAGQGLAAAFAAAFPSLPADSEIPSLANFLTHQDSTQLHQPSDQS